MMLRAAVIAASTVLLFAGCASTPPEKDAEYRAPKVYRTGSNIAVKDYGAANIDVERPDVLDSINRAPGRKVSQ